MERLPCVFHDPVDMSDEVATVMLENSRLPCVVC